jgi:Lipocalin-like domain
MSEYFLIAYLTRAEQGSRPGLNGQVGGHYENSVPSFNDAGGRLTAKQRCGSRHIAQTTGGKLDIRLGQDVKPDGRKVDPWGPNAKGAAMFDANGRFTFMIMRSDLPKFASNNRAQATAEEGKAVAQGMIAFYGTYTVNEADKTLTTRIEGSSYPNLIGGEQKRIITSLTGDELGYTNPTTSTGTKAESVWRRAK